MGVYLFIYPGQKLTGWHGTSVCPSFLVFVNGCSCSFVAWLTGRLHAVDLHRPVHGRHHCLAPLSDTQGTRGVSRSQRNRPWCCWAGLRIEFHCPLTSQSFHRSSHHPRPRPAGPYRFAPKRPSILVALICAYDVSGTRRPTHALLRMFVRSRGLWRRERAAAARC